MNVLLLDLVAMLGFPPALWHSLPYMDAVFPVSATGSYASRRCLSYIQSEAYVAVAAMASAVEKY